MTFPLEGPQSKGWSSVQGSLQETSPIPLRAEACQLYGVALVRMKESLKALQALRRSQTTVSGAFGRPSPFGRPARRRAVGSTVRTDIQGQPVTDSLSLLPTYLPFPFPTLAASQSDANWKSQLW